MLKEEIDIYQRKRPKSKQLWEKSLQSLAGGVSHNIRNFGLPSIGAFPSFIHSAKGSKLMDVDGNEYIDCWNGHFAMILGHNHPIIQKVIEDRSKYGWHFGTNTENQVKLAETLIRDNPSIEKVRFCTSGTEATMYASRLARAFTKKRVVAKAKLGWHGANDTLFYDVGGIIVGKDTPGILDKEEAGVFTFPINSREIFNFIQKNATDLAAVILEPVLGGGGGFPVDTDFLKRLREETEKCGALLIFDEVITGYRFSYGLLQNDLRIFPDLTTMGKIIGGGLPIGAVGGKKEVIALATPGMKNQVLIGGGTFSGYPLSMATGLKTLELLKESNEEYKRINTEGTKLQQELDQFFREEMLPIVATGFKSIIMLHIMSKWVEEPTIKEIIELTDRKRESLLQLALFNRGIIGLHGLGSLSMAHNQSQILQLLEIVKEVATPVTKSTIE
ncbi:MAG: aminotransferase class III-fold pyridoxal phosphate-dependent enzyme [Candidatus Heimdallarchaeota archaeon]|nr:MAG: aminotransferase class III-fold pyridoxal phosphate-dependent enzyme [Candidatus Heimdallarchaeota archaeon]